MSKPEKPLGKESLMDIKLNTFLSMLYERLPEGWELSYKTYDIFHVFEVSRETAGKTYMFSFKCSERIFRDLRDPLAYVFSNLKSEIEKAMPLID